MRVERSNYNQLVMRIDQALAENVRVSDDSVIVELKDGRSISAPLAWYPRLVHGSVKERNHWRFIGQGRGIHWEDLDEDISMQNLLLGQPSGESQISFQRWLDGRTSAKIIKKPAKKRPLRRSK